MADCCGKIYISDKGTKIILDCGTDISTATQVKIMWKDPDETTGEWIGAIENNNYVTYTNPSSWDITGTWRFQAYVLFPTGYEFYGETALYEISPLFE